MAQKRCRSIGGIVFDLIATPKAPPCPRGRPRAEKTSGDGDRKTVTAPAKRSEAAEPATVEMKIGPAATERAKPAPRGPRFRPFGVGRASERKKPLPPAVDKPPQVGDHVTVVDLYGHHVDHAIVTKAVPKVVHRQAGIGVKFTSGTYEGFERWIQLTRIRAGWLEPRDGFTPWKGPTKDEDAEGIVVQTVDYLQDKGRVPILSTADVRAAAPGKLSKAAFDAAALRLSRKGVVTLFQHDHAAAASEAARDAMVRDGSRFFNAIGLRQS
jgi:hypothetical protein